MRRGLVPALFTLLLLVRPSAPACAATPCENSGRFDTWLRDFRAEAEAEGISRKVIATALDGVQLDPAIIARDRKQGFFWQSFADFSRKLATADRIVNGRKRIAANRALFDRVEKDYGVPAPVIAAFWALESDFGLAMGKVSILPSLATLAYDCRRGPMFREELKAALRIIERGDLKPSEMIGSWAGELGQTQFLPSHYYRLAVDYDTNGRRDLIRSTPDLLATTAAFLKELGWQRGQPWLEEVRVPARMAWEEADIAIAHPRRHWAAAGVTRADGAPLPADELPASLMLPMGRNGTAFLAYPNFHSYTKWNLSLNYALTAAYLATRIDGAAAMRSGNGPVPAFGFEEIRQLQATLKERGFEVGAVDGKLGAGTRAAVRQAQIKLGLPPDAYPTPELLEKLKRGLGQVRDAAPPGATGRPG